MKNILLAVALLLSASVFAGDPITLTGFIGDDHCGKKSGPDHAECAKKCVKGGAKPVLIVGKKVYSISNPEKLGDLVGDKVEITGEVDGDVITIEKVSKAA
ncbi:MAG: hypothetical protein JNK79_15725 [Chitinophagaceae bacterium]|nr:hypothetical protein [Chitinophagaceae bacterium]